MEESGISLIEVGITTTSRVIESGTQPSFAVSVTEIVPIPVLDERTSIWLVP